MPPGPSGALFPRLDGDERRRALADPGPSWREYALFSLLKAWSALAWLVLDVFVALAFLVPLDVPGLVVGLAVALYGEWLLYQFFWYRPPPRNRGDPPFRRRWYRPVPYGRWTPEADRARRGEAPVPIIEEPGIDPREFL